MWELHKLIHNRTKERSEEVRAIKRMNGSSLIFPWKREKKKVNNLKSEKFTTEKPLPEVSIPGAWPGQFKGGERVTLCQIEGTHQIVMSTSMPYLKKVCKGGGEVGVGGGGGEVTGSTRPFSPSQRLCYPIETGSPVVLLVRKIRNSERLS